MYLGTKIHKFKEKDTDDDQLCLSMSGNHYVKNVVAKVEEKLMNHGCQINAKQQLLFTNGYRPEMYTSPELDAKHLNFFQKIIGCVCWAIELAKSDIVIEVSIFSRYFALPCCVHHDQCFNVYAGQK